MPQSFEHKTLSLLAKENKHTKKPQKGGHTLGAETFGTVPQLLEQPYGLAMPVQQQQQSSQASSFPTSGKALGHVMQKKVHPRDYVTCWERCPSPWLWPAAEQTRFTLEVSSEVA